LRKSKVNESPVVNGRFTSHRVSENPFTLATDEKEDSEIISPKKRRADSEKA
jgi:hypothetical protein